MTFLRVMDFTRVGSAQRLLDRGRARLHAIWFRAIQLQKYFALSWPPTDVVFLLLAPFAAVPLFGICLLNQDTFVDPWFYTAYGRMLKEMVATSGWTYYNVRFPVVGSISLLSSIFAEPLGYLLLRYLVYVIAALPLYYLLSRTSGRLAAIVGVILLVASPLFARIVLWDLPIFVAIPAALAGMCLWLMPSPHRGLCKVLAGFLFAAAINSHAFVGTALASFYVAEFGMACWGARVKRFACDAAWAAIGAVICIVLGLIYYSLAVQPVGPTTLLMQTLAAVTGGLVYHQTHMEPASVIVIRDLVIYLPLLMTVTHGVLLGRHVFSDTVAARIFWFSSIYCIFFVFFHFGAGRNVLGYFFYAAFLFPTIILQAPLILRGLTKSLSPTIATGAWTCFGTVLIAIPLLNFHSAQTHSLFVSLYNTLAGLIVVCCIAAALLILSAIRIGRWISKLVAAAMLALLLQFTTFTDHIYARIFSKDSRQEFALYMASLDLIRILRTYDVSEHRVLIWYPRGEYSMASLSFMNLGHTLQPPFAVAEAGLPLIGDYERKRLNDPASAYVLLMARTNEVIDEGLAALRAAGANLQEEIRTQLGTDPAYQIKAILVTLRR
jgi:hypothetical protein